LADLRARPFAQHRAAKAEQNRGQRHAVAEKWPMTGSRGEGGERQRGGGDQQIAASAVDDSKEDLSPRARALRPGS
jgi:hypothetical protein